MARLTFETRNQLKHFGLSIRRWRAVRGLPAQMLADRAGISRETLRSIEMGSGGVSIGSIFAVLEVLGLQGVISNAVEPLNTEFGRDRAANMDKKRVRIRAIS